ncbi:hypothetical protein TRFO_21082 [Tritrichomonas foetus]|uniref:Protein kinase domain-containing protein n=1 Tax=Tritrichomonas foetus TaxID=1144522 RepID=A0A1J4KEH5_9EUKA|nr:hypothetical protein TRFO_21082 [Tritrichomonas foetus]|eukprot:OHT09817.1 hypothetical protein TRFO_21082 [Tritrichomonas foetus]
MSNSFDINEYKIKRTLSADTQASVLYEHVKTKKQIVIKELLHKPFEGNPETQFPVEIEKIKPLCHMALAHFITSIPPRSGHTYRIVTEFYPSGSLETLVNKLAKNNPPDDYSPTKMSIIIYGIATALKYLHEKGVIHGNLRPTNVLLDEHMQPRLVDYGFKRDFANSQYCSPELFQKQDYDFSTDIYSFGMLLCYIYVQESPFDESLTFENLVDFVPDGERPILPGNVPQKIADLIEKMWSQNPADRPSISYIHRLLGDDDYLFPGTNVEEFQEYVKRANSTGPEPIMKPVGDGNPNNMYRFGIMLKKKASLDKKKMIDAARYFKAAADKGVSEAAFEYAQLALKGIGIPQDTEDAAKYFKMAADSGNPEAMYEFAEMVTLGLGTPKDDALAAQYYKKAGDNGNAEAMHKYMKFEASKNTGQTKKDDLMKGFKAAADSGVGQSAYEYGLLAKKEGKTSDSIKYFKQAADNGIAPAAFELAKIFQQDRNKVAVTAKYFQIAADGGIMEAAYQFGLIMQTCKTPLRKMEETAKYFKIAADSGIAGALYQMFLMVHNGIGMSRSEPDANRYLEMASEKNFFPALYRSALVMQAYDNIPEYRKLSGDNFKKAADSNNLDAVYHFAIMKKTGACCVKKNIKQSAHYFKVAADFGNPYAMYQYALMLLTGNGVTADESQTIQYYKKAADAGFPDAMYQYALIMKATPKQNATKQTMAEATKYFKMALDAGVTDQQYQQALTFQTGKNAHLKQKEAAECFKKAAESSGNPNAYYQYALIVQAMDYEPGNAKIAAESFQKAADGGHVDAAYRYALMIKTGAAGAKKNLMESARYFKIAADGGNANAAYQYALMKHMGNGILREDDEAAKYFKIASDSTSNNVDAMYQYAFMQPISNEKEAAEYFQMANTTY